MLHLRRPQNKVSSLKYWVIHPIVNSLTVLILCCFSFQTHHDCFWVNCWVTVLTRHPILWQELYTLYSLFWLLISLQVELTTLFPPYFCGICLFPYLPSADASILTAFNEAVCTHCAFHYLVCRTLSTRFEESVNQPITVFFLRLIF